MLTPEVLWLVFVWDDRTHLPGQSSPGLPPPSLLWSTQMDFNIGGAARLLPGDSPSSWTNRLFSNPTAPIGVAMPRRNTQAASGLAHQSVTLLGQVAPDTSAGFSLTCSGHRGEDLRLPRIQPPLAFLLGPDRPG